MKGEKMSDFLTKVIFEVINQEKLTREERIARRLMGYGFHEEDVLRLKKEGEWWKVDTLVSNASG